MPRVGGLDDAALPGPLERDHHLAEDVALTLVDGAVADPHRARAGIPRQVVELALDELAPAVDAVHDLHVLGVARDRPQQPVAPQPGLLEVAAAEQRLERERRVAQPAVAVVPVALAAEVLRQRRRRRRHDPAGLPVAEHPQDEQRPGHRLGVRALVAAPRPPLPAERQCLLDATVDLERRRHRVVAAEPRRGEGERLAGADVELVDVPAVVGVGEPVTAQDEHVGAGDGRDDRVVGALAVVLAPGHPGPGRAVAEADDPLVRHPDRARDSLDPAQQVGAAVGERHDVGDPDDARVGLVGRLEDERVPDVAPRRPGAPGRWARAASGRCRASRAGRRSTRASRSGAGTASRPSPPG